MNSADLKRETTGRFAKGHGGRPKGAKNQRRAFSSGEFEKSVAEETTMKLEGLLGKAVAVMDEQLSEGNLKAAVWVLDRMTPRNHHKPSSSIPDADMASIEGNVQTAETTSQMAAEGQLGLDEANRFMTILTNCGQLRGFLQIGQLREMIVEFEQQGLQGKAAAKVDYPKWGNLQPKSS
jgi:hypothetical protein